MKLVKSKGAVVVTDRLGSVRRNANGESFSYYPYGEERTSTADNREKFGTYMRDNPGQDYADQRYYAVGTGRFFTPDPSGRKSANRLNPSSWNMFSYGLGDPIGLIDPHGLDADSCDVSLDFGCDEPDWDGDPEQNSGVQGGGTPVVSSTVGYYTSCAPGETINSDGTCYTPLWGSNAGNATTILSSVASSAGPIVNALLVATPAVPFTAVAGAGLLGLGSGTVAASGTAIGTVGASPQGQQVIVNIGGAIADAGAQGTIILQTGQVGDLVGALENAAAIANATGQQVVLGMGNAIPFATGQVNQVIVNNVPIGYGTSAFYGPWIDPNEIARILAPGGTVVGTSAQTFWALIGKP